MVSSLVFHIASFDCNSGVFLIYLYLVLFLIQCEKVIDMFGHQGAWMLEGLSLTQGRIGLLSDSSI